LLDGDAVGSEEGTGIGALEGIELVVGIDEGLGLGSVEGDKLIVGSVEGLELGALEGDKVAVIVGAADGLTDTYLLQTLQLL